MTVRDIDPQLVVIAAIGGIIIRSTYMDLMGG
jgi:hypothetical protein